MDYEASIEWLFSTQTFGIKLGLQNMQRLLELLDLPGNHPHILHVAGTNGKGSTCAFAESICRHHGLHTGLFTSPHLIKANERIRVDGNPIADQDLAGLINHLRDITADWNPHPTFFELILAMALVHFDRMKVDVVILETGMGGRLDATSAVTPTSTAITAIGLDHTSWLGNTISEIAREKAGILKPGVPLALGSQKPAANRVILQQATQLGCPVTSSEALNLGDSTLGLYGAHQQQNAALAIQLIQNSGIQIDTQLLNRGLEETRWPARFQVLDRHNQRYPIVIDGAHNPAASATLVAAWHERFPQTVATLLFASLEEKDFAATFRPLTTMVERILITEIDTSRSLPAEQVADALRREFPEIANFIEVAPDAAHALRQLLAEDTRPILITGSLFLAGIALAELENLSRQRSLQ
jgi:dihydrofolate synthase/folylpolyglutamate synthase